MVSRSPVPTGFFLIFFSMFPFYRTDHQKMVLGSLPFPSTLIFMMTWKSFSRTLAEPAVSNIVV
ncbi:uncharacterized protein EI90DRAFT_3082771 [Cantharellus anzutake]|uniref:uncharacterized protein n=1 Tax=Cantharellus anzutake TaxID=1750568 RepID=UPI001908C95B|nr:uncharacterized protein EI90DRAFT_3082771 [Cantharellus anzutake]KAF8318937.1 hypothetical protein EI90DRAFT_3082771 [Cantharellus anzutake]